MTTKPLARRDRFGLAAFAAYLAVSVALFGRAALAHPSSAYIGVTEDPTVYMWFLAWWPYAIAHHLNPFVTDLLWAPAGFNVTWTTGIPLAAFAAAPITARFGPVVAYNLMCLLAPALAGWTAFLLCRRICGRWLPALAGGAIFAFSGYMLVELSAHLVLILVFTIPLAAHLAIRRLEGDLGAAVFAFATAATLAATFLISLEIAATLTFFGAVALALGYWLGDDANRLRIRALAAPLAAAYAIAGAAVSPYIHFFFRPGHPRSPINSPGAYSADLLNFIVPTPANWIGQLPPLAELSRRFPGAMVDTCGYLGLPLIVIAILHLRAHRGETRARVLVWSAAIAAVAALGPRLHLAGAETVPMPWKIARHLPLIDNALPARFAIYADLALAMIAALWLADAAVGRNAKIGALAAIALFMAPNPGRADHVTPVDLPAFFANGGYRQALAPGEITIALPYGANGPSMLWQALSGMYFRMAGGWTSITPREFQSWPAVNALLRRSVIPDFADQLYAFAANHQARTVIIDERNRAAWAPLLNPLGIAPDIAGGVAIYRLPDSELARWRGVGALAMERRSDAQRFAQMLAAGQRWLAAHRPAARLTPLRAERAGLLPARTANDPDPRTSNGLFLGPLPDNAIGVGVVGTWDALAPLARQYQAAGNRVYFPYPHRLGAAPRGDLFMRLMVVAFSPDGLAAAMPPPLPPTPR